MSSEVLTVCESSGGGVGAVRFICLLCKMGEADEDCVDWIGVGPGRLSFFKSVRDERRVFDMSFDMFI